MDRQQSHATNINLLIAEFGEEFLRRKALMQGVIKSLGHDLVQRSRQEGVFEQILNGNIVKYPTDHASKESDVYLTCEDGQLFVVNETMSEKAIFCASSDRCMNAPIRRQVFCIVHYPESQGGGGGGGAINSVPPDASIFTPTQSIGSGSRFETSPVAIPDSEEGEDHHDPDFRESQQTNSVVSRPPSLPSTSLTHHSSQHTEGRARENAYLCQGSSASSSGFSGNLSIVKRSATRKSVVTSNTKKLLQHIAKDKGVRAAKSNKSVASSVTTSVGAKAQAGRSVASPQLPSNFTSATTIVPQTQSTGSGFRRFSQCPNPVTGRGLVPVPSPQSQQAAPVAATATSTPVSESEVEENRNRSGSIGSQLGDARTPAAASGSTKPMREAGSWQVGRVTVGNPSASEQQANNDVNDPNQSGDDVRSTAQIHTNTQSPEIVEVTDSDDEYLETPESVGESSQASTRASAPSWMACIPKQIE